MWSLTLDSMDALAAALMLSPFHGVVGTSGLPMMWVILHGAFRLTSTYLLVSFGHAKDD